MKLRTKVVLAQLPIVVALAVTIVVGSWVTRSLGRGSEAILKDNYRSVLAAERMKEFAERVDSGVVFSIIGRRDRGTNQIADNLPKFEAELSAQEGNITESGESSATTTLRTAWTTYRRSVDRVVADPAASSLGDRYFAELLPQFLAVKDAADAVLALNQDAMMSKSDRAQSLASRWNTLLVGVSIAGLLLGLVASSVLTSRTLRPLSVLGQTARRFGEGDMLVRARVDSKDEIGALARELNTMAEHVHKYRQSSLGELIEAQRAAQATIDSLPDPVLVIGLDGELHSANVAAETILKVRTEPGALATLDPAIRAVVERLRQHVGGGHGTYTPKGLEDSVKLTTVDGVRLLQPRAAPLYADEGDVTGATIVFQDVTRLQRFEELRNDLVATVAHELRTPLTSLRMAVHLLAENTVGPLTDRQGDLVFAAREDCDRLQAIVDELLDLSRIQADRVELRLAPQDPELLVAEALENQRAAAAAKSIQLRSEVLPDMPAVTVDHERLLLVLGNLIANAIRYGHSGGNVTVRALARADVVRFEVEDDGPGVPAEYRDAIFERYVRVPGAAHGGAGLGLHIAGQNVRAHGGTIGVVSDAGHGSTFWFTVPRASLGEL